MSYAGLTTTTNAKGRTQRETHNALDEVIEAREHAGATVSDGGSECTGSGRTMHI